MTTWSPSEEQLRAWGRLSEDYNPLHFDSAFAAEAGFSSRIIFGALALAHLQAQARRTLSADGLVIKVRFVTPMPAEAEMNFDVDIDLGALNLYVDEVVAVTGTVETLDDQPSS